MGLCELTDMQFALIQHVMSLMHVDGEKWLNQDAATFQYESHIKQNEGIICVITKHRLILWLPISVALSGATAPLKPVITCTNYSITPVTKKPHFKSVVPANWFAFLLYFENLSYFNITSQYKKVKYLNGEIPLLNIWAPNHLCTEG